MKEEYRFVDNNTFLIAFVDDKSGRQQLVMEHRDDWGNVLIRDNINCIHTAVMDIPVEDFEDIVRDEQFEENVLKIRSSENLKKINLAPEEKFKAFKSWVAGIAEAGYEALFLENQIETQAHLLYPIAQMLMKFLIKSNPEFVYHYIDWVDRECRYEGVKHGPSIIANFDLITKTIVGNSNGLNISDTELFKIIDLMLEIYPKFFSNLLSLNNRDIKLHLIKSQVAREIKDYILLFKDKDWEVRSDLAVYPEALKFEEYKLLFYDESWVVRSDVAANPGAPLFEEYKLLFDDEIWMVRSAVAANPGASLFEEYKLLFDDESWEVRSAVAANPGAPLFEEYKLLFYDEDADVRSEVAANPGATNFEEYKLLFKDVNLTVRRAVAENPEATKFKEYKLLFHDPNLSIRKRALSTIINKNKNGA